MVYTLMTVTPLPNILRAISPLNNVYSLLIVLLRVHRFYFAQIATSFCHVLLLHHLPRPCLLPPVSCLYY